MAEYTQGKTSELQTYTPNTQLVEPAISSGPAMFAAAAQGAAEGYSKYSIFKADQESRDVVDSLNQDLQDIEDGVDLSGRLSSSLAKLAENNPHVQELSKSLGTLGTGAKQRQQAKLIYTLRAEAALKKSVSRAPGLRQEIAATASRNFGFDPTSATVNLLLKGIDDEWKAMQKGGAEPDLYLLKKTYESAQAAGLPGVYNPQDPQGSIDHNNALIHRHRKYTADAEDAAKALTSGSMSEQDAIAAYGRATRGVLDAQLSGILSTYNNMAAHVTTEEGLRALQVEFLPQVQALSAELSSNLATSFGQLDLSAEGRATAQTIQDDLEQSITKGLNLVLESKNFGQAQGRVRLLEMFQQDWGMDFAMANKALVTLNSMMPGTMSSVLPIALMNSAGSLSQIKEMIIDGFNSADPATRKQAALGNFIASLQDQTAFEKMSEDDKKTNMKISVEYIKGIQQGLEKGKLNMDEVEFEELSNAFASGLQLSNQFVSKDWTAMAKLSTAPVYHAMIKHLENGSPEQKFKAAVISGSAIEASQKFLSKDLPTAIKGSPTLSGKEDLFYFDQETGELSFKQHSKVAEQYSNYSSRSTVKKTLDIFSDSIDTRLGRMASDEFREATKVVTDFKSVLDSVEAMKHMDPDLKDLSRAQIAELLAGRALRGAGVNMVGEATPIPVAGKAERAQAIDEEQLARDLADATENLKHSLQGSARSPEQEALAKELETLTNSRRNLIKQEQEILTRVNALKGA